jgi:glycosyltransferase involved in cell wall biosynthesis
LHDIQEKEFPRNFSRDQRIYRDLRVRYSISKALKIQVSSEFMKMELRKHYKVKLDQIVVIPEGVDLDLFKNLPKIRKATDKTLVFLPGKFLKHKNHIDFFKAINLINTPSDIEIVVADNLENIPNEITQIIKKLSNIQLKCVGELTDKQILSLYQSSDLTVVTSLYESSSLPILESIATGTMVLAADIPSHREMARVLPIKLYESQNLISLAESFDQLIDLNFHNENSSIKYQLKAFDWENIASKYLAIFKVYF